MLNFYTDIIKILPLFLNETAPYHDTDKQTDKLNYIMK